MFSSLFNLKNTGRVITGTATVITISEFALKWKDKTLKNRLEELTKENATLRDNALQKGESLLEEKTKLMLSSEDCNVRKFIQESKEFAEK
jgi:hypothetical protein